MPIAIAPINTDIRVIRILADEKTKKHLENLGITINSTIQIVSIVAGNVILSVKGGRLALDKSIATKILVA